MRSLEGQNRKKANVYRMLCIFTTRQTFTVWITIRIFGAALEIISIQWGNLEKVQKRLLCRKMWSEIPPPIIAGASITNFVNRGRPKTKFFSHCKKSMKNSMMAFSWIFFDRDKRLWETFVLIFYLHLQKPLTYRGQRLKTFWSLFPLDLSLIQVKFQICFFDDWKISTLCRFVRVTVTKLTHV